MKIAGAAVMLVLAAAAAGAQLTPPSPPPPSPPSQVKPGLARISGLVLDSLHANYLVGAEVVLEGALASTLTDSLGRFRIDSLPPGRYQVGVFHPVLDTLGIALASQPFRVGPDSTSVVLMAVPSARTLVARTCAIRPEFPDNSAIVGRVVDPETLQPVSGADVSIAWVHLEVSKQLGIRETPRVIRATTDTLGRFGLCGLPSDLQATLQAKRANSVTAEVPVSLGTGSVELFARTLLLSSADSGAKSGSAVVTGRVLLEGAPTVGGSRVELAGTGAVATTDATGRFTLRNLPSGTHVLVARHLGYAADVVAVDLSSREPRDVTITLPKFVHVMDPVLVSARRSASLERVGFARRQKSGTGYFIGPERLDRMRPNHLTDILRQVPGLRIVQTPEGETVTTSRGTAGIRGDASCVRFFLDDMPWHSATPGDINMFVNGPEVAAVEVYQGTMVPVRYSGAENCTTILVWTKMRIRS